MCIYFLRFYSCPLCCVATNAPILKANTRVCQHITPTTTRGIHVFYYICFFVHRSRTEFNCQVQSGGRASVAVAVAVAVATGGGGALAQLVAGMDGHCCGNSSWQSSRRIQIEPANLCGN